MGVEIFQVEQAVDLGLPWRDEPGFRDSIRSTAARQIGEHILATAASFREIAPERDEPPITRYRWSVGIERDVAEIEMREKQIEQAAKRGRMQAAAIAIKMAARYDSLTGGCAGVIASALRNAAREISEA